MLTAKITGKHSGVAVIKLDSFRLNVSFDFEAHPDSYGVPGSEFTTVDITQLTVNEITDINGKSYNDFTEFEDIRNINSLLKASSNVTSWWRQPNERLQLPYLQEDDSC